MIVESVSPVANQEDAVGVRFTSSGGCRPLWGSVNSKQIGFSDVASGFEAFAADLEGTVRRTITSSHHERNALLTRSRSMPVEPCRTEASRYPVDRGDESCLSRQIVWHGLCFSVPGGWELMRHAINPDAGRLVLVDRRRHRMSVAWVRVDESPDVRQMLKDHQSRDLEADGDARFEAFVGPAG